MKKITFLVAFLMASVVGQAQCEPVSTFNQGFESTDDGAIPTCWNKIIAGPGLTPTVQIETVGFNGTGQSKSVRISHDLSEPTAHVILVSPPVNSLSAGTHRLRFSTFSNEDLSIEVGTLDGPTEEANFNLVGDVQVQIGVHQYAIDFTDYTGTDTFVGIRVTSGYTVFLDDIIWEVAPLCPDVFGISIASTNTTSATLKWNVGAEEEWDIVYGTLDVTDPQTLTPISPAPTVTPEGIISGLLPGTPYKAWVRSVCGENNGNWMDPITFTTDCSPTTIFSEDFDTTETGKLPACWSAIVRGPQATPEYENVMIKDWNSVSGSNSVALSKSFDDTEVFLITPSVSTLPLGTHRIKFNAFTYNENATLEMGTLSSNDNDATFTMVEATGLTGEYTEYVVDYTVYDGSDIFVAFRMSAGTAIFIDDVRWELAPECPDVAAIATTGTTTNSASFSWEAGGGETAWDIVYGATSETDPTTLTPIAPAPSGNPVGGVSGLEPNTTYKLWVRSSCGAESKGAWIGPKLFKTACLPTVGLNESFDTTAIATLPDCWSSIIRGEDTPDFANIEVVDFSYYSATNAVRIQSIPLEGADVESDVILVSPNLSTLQAGTYRLKFFSSSSDPGVLEIGTLDTATSTAVFSLLQDVDVSDILTEHTVSFADYTGTDTYIGIRHKTGHAIYLDNIRWELIPLCSDVQEIAMTEVGTTTAALSWAAGGSETNWQVTYGLATVSDPDTLTPSAILPSAEASLSNLEQNTNYKVWVRSVCGAPNGNGGWVGPIAFKTECASVNVPYTEDFESTEGSLPACTLNINAGQGNAWRVINEVLTYRYDDENAADTWFFTPGINLVAGIDYTISYTYGNNGDDVEKMNVFFGDTREIEAMNVQLADHQEITNEADETYSQTFGVDATGVYYFGFHAYSDADQGRLFVDNINIAPTLKNDDFITENFKFSPNPVKDVLNLSYKQNITSVAVYNLLGQKVLENTINANTTQVDMSGLAAGGYLVKVTSDSHSKTIKIIKE